METGHGCFLLVFCFSFVCVCVICVFAIRHFPHQQTVFKKRDAFMEKKKVREIQWWGVGGKTPRMQGGKRKKNAWTRVFEQECQIVKRTIGKKLKKSEKKTKEKERVGGRFV